MTHIALTIAGSDSGGGAGIQADLKTFSALGVYGCSVVTAVTAQNTRAVTAVHEVPADVVAAQLRAVLDDLDVQAIKIGMLLSPAIVRAVAEGLNGCNVPVILDPVMVAKSGDALLQDDAVAAMVDLLFPLVDLVTPNLPEAARLLGLPADDPQIGAQAGRLLGMGPRHVLLKGGHGTGETCTDLMLSRGGSFELSAPRSATRNTHGTGCTYSAAIAAFLARATSASGAMEGAVRAAHAYLQGAIAQADTLNIGGGHGPVHHFHEVWR